MLNILLLAVQPAQAVTFTESADVVATRSIAAPPEAVYAALVDLKQLEAASSPECIYKWEYGSVSAGAGASVMLTYRPGPMHRRLTATFSKLEEPQLIDLDHAGNKGFVTRFKLSPTDDGTRVEMHTYLSGPPWPFQRAYFNRVQPAWTACQEETLAGIARTVEGR